MIVGDTKYNNFEIDTEYLFEDEINRSLGIDVADLIKVLTRGIPLV